MPRPLSYDLRARVLAAVDGGLSCRQAAERFGVNPSSAIRWQALHRAGGDARPKPSGGDRLFQRTEAHVGPIQAALDEVADVTLSELKARLAGRSASTCVASLWRYFRRHRITRKTYGKAAERTVEGLWTTIGKLLDASAPTECGNYLRLRLRRYMSENRSSPWIIKSLARNQMGDVDPLARSSRQFGGLANVD